MGEKKVIKNVLNFPEGAISAGTINKINEVYLERAFEEDGAHDLMTILLPFSEGKVLEYVGQMNKAKETFQKILKKNPKNRWAIEALRQIEHVIN